MINGLYRLNGELLENALRCNAPVEFDVVEKEECYEVSWSGALGLRTACYPKVNYREKEKGCLDSVVRNIESGVWVKI